MKQELIDKVKKVLGDDYKLYFESDSVEVEFWSPAGENMIVTVHGGSLREMERSAESQYDDFDADYHAAQIYRAKHGSEDEQIFFSSAPESLSELLADAKAIKKSYKDIFIKLLKAANKEPKDVQYK